MVTSGKRFISLRVQSHLNSMCFSWGAFWVADKGIKAHFGVQWLLKCGYGAVTPLCQCRWGNYRIGESHKICENESQIAQIALWSVKWSYQCVGVLFFVGFVSVFYFLNFWFRFSLQTHSVLLSELGKVCSAHKCFTVFPCSNSRLMFFHWPFFCV